MEDKNCEECHVAIADHDDMPNDIPDNSTAIMDADTEKGGVAELDVGMVHPQDPEENDEVSWSGMRITGEADEELISDEGWQEANSKGRSGNTTTSRKFGRKKPVLAKLNILNEHSNFRESRHGREITSPAKHVPPKIISSESSPLKHSKAHNLTIGEDSFKLRAKASLPKVISVPAPRTSTTTSKSLSYKEVALARPGTVLKPPSDKTVDINVEIPETQMCNVTPETSKDEENKRDSEVEASTNDVTEGTQASATEEERFKEINVSKLSAAAEPFNPGPLSMTHPLNSVAVTSVYDVTASQGMLSEPVVPQIANGVPCGPRSPMYHGAKDSLHMKHGFLNFRTPIEERMGSSPPRIMNPNAPEFFPRRAWQTSTIHAGIEVSTESDTSYEISDRAQEEKPDEKYNNEPNVSFPRKTVSESEKSELARQILLSFIVKSVQHNMDTDGVLAVSEKKKFDQRSEDYSDAIENDSAIIKIRYGNDQGKTNGCAPDQSSSCELQDDVDKKKEEDGEGFTVVTRRRKNRQQLPNGVTGLYSQQQSICASVR